MHYIRESINLPAHVKDVNQIASSSTFQLFGALNPSLSLCPRVLSRYCTPTILSRVVLDHRPKVVIDYRDFEIDRIILIIDTQKSTGKLVDKDTKLEHVAGKQRKYVSSTSVTNDR